MEDQSIKMSKQAQQYVANLTQKINRLQDELTATKSELEKLTDQNGVLQKKADLNQVLDDIGNKAQGAFLAAIEKEFLSYGSGLGKLVNAAVERKSEIIGRLLDQAVESCIDHAEFKSRLLESLRHKLARVLVSKLEGEVERTVNTWKSDPERRAKLTLQVAELLKNL